MSRTKSTTSTVRFPELLLMVSLEPLGSSGSWDYGHVRGWITTTDGMMLYTSDESRGGKFKGVVFNAQTYRDYLVQDHHSNSMPVYGYRAEWKGDNKGLSELKAGVAALTEIERKMDKAHDQYGPPATFGAWVQRLAGAIGLDKVKVSGKEYAVSPQTAASIIDQSLRDWASQEKERRGMVV